MNAATVAFWRKGDKNFWCRGVLSDEVLRFRGDKNTRRTGTDVVPFGHSKS
jgi:hypothetical protein